MDLWDQVIAWLAEQEVEVYLVGGCVRDRFLGRPVYDLDLAVAGDGLYLARRLANRFGGAYYPLDEARGTGRAILTEIPCKGREPTGKHTEIAGRGLVVDVARLRGPDLAADLADRDFTVNALAANVRAPGDVLDQHSGLADLRARIIRPVSEASIRNDPLRALRAVRLAAALEFTLAPETESLIRRDGPAISRVSGERVRDELARLLALPHAAGSLTNLDDLGLLAAILPELEPLRHLAQPPPHHLEALPHSLETVRCLELILARLAPLAEHQAPEPFTCRILPLTEIPLGELDALAPFAARLHAHLSGKTAPTLGQVSSDARPRLVILKLGALLHDVGKARAHTMDSDGQIRSPGIGHDQIGARMVEAALRRLRFDAVEIRLGKTIIGHHMRPLLLASQKSVSARAVYRFFRDTEEAGLEVLIHALADHLAATGIPSTGYASGVDAQAGQPTSLVGDWPHLVLLVARMLTDYWERPTERIAPPELIDGYDLLHEFGLPPGPHIGKLLEAVREAQVSGEVHTRDEALALVRARLAQ